LPEAELSLSIDGFRERMNPSTARYSSAPPLRYQGAESGSYRYSWANTQCNISEKKAEENTYHYSPHHSNAHAKSYLVLLLSIFSS
jgi:hypothetical protein